MVSGARVFGLCPLLSLTPEQGAGLQVASQFLNERALDCVLVGGVLAFGRGCHSCVHTGEPSRTGPGVAAVGECFLFRGLADSPSSAAVPGGCCSQSSSLYWVCL